MPTPTSTFRFSDLTRRQIAALVAATGHTQTAIVSTAIDRMYREETQTMTTYYITEEMLGDQATADDARRMVELLAERGYDVEYGNPRHGQHDDEIRQKDWNECLDILSREKYG